MSDSQPTLQTFSNSDEQDDSETSPHPLDEEDIHPENPSLTTPVGYPESLINQQADGTITVPMCLPNGETTAEFTVIGGSGGMGPGSPLESPEETAEIIQKLVNAPCILSGGGMGAVGGSGFELGQLVGVDADLTTDCQSDDGSVRVTINQLFKPNGRTRDRNRRARLGSYELAVPVTKSDCEAAVEGLSAWKNDEVDHFFPGDREAAEESNRLESRFEDLKPGDTVEVPAYSTTLTVISEPYETYVTIPKIDFGDKHYSVTSVTVDNPRGGFYQLGIRSRSDATKAPMCYLSGSSSSAPSPNTSFRRDEKFSAQKVEMENGTRDETAKTVGPDEEVLNSPLPERCVRTSLSDIDGVGEKTARTIRSELDHRVDAHKLAYSLHTDEGPYHGADVHRALNGLAAKSKILDKVEEIATSLDT